MPDFPPQPWRTLRRRELLDIRPWLRVYRDELELPDGRVVDDFYTVDMPDHAMVVALTEDGKIVTERNYKHGPRQVCLNLPAGYLEPDEDPLEAAKRELLEETGYQAERWTFLGAFQVDGNRGCGRAIIYLAQDARKVAEPNSGDLEEMQILLMPLPDLLQALRDGHTPALGVAAALGLASLALTD